MRPPGVFFCTEHRSGRRLRLCRHAFARLRCAQRNSGRSLRHVVTIQLAVAHRPQNSGRIFELKTSHPKQDGPPAGPVLFFDGECGLCQRIVRVLLRLDRAGRLRFAPLQGPTAQDFLRAQGLPTEDFDTLIFVPDWSRRDQREYLVRTAGVIGALRSTERRLASTLAALLAIVPAGLRDAGYRGVARWRRRIFGPWQPGSLARSEWAGRFLE